MSSTTNIAVVVFDTLRKDTFDSHFSWLSAEGVDFDNAWTTANWTIPAHASLFSGKHASEVGTHAGHRRFMKTGTNLPKLLSDADYRTRGLTANRTIAPEWGFGRGFDYYRPVDAQTEWLKLIDTDSPRPIRYPKFLLNAVTSEQDTLPVLKEAVRDQLSRTWFERYMDQGASMIEDWLTATNFGKPEFLFLNLMEPHSPYSPPARYLSGESAELSSAGRATVTEPVDDPETIRSAYDDSVRYLSEKYRAIHEQLKEDFDVIITVSDHGEGLGEGGMWGHPPMLNPELTNVPLVITGDGASQLAEPSGEPVNLLDIYQTVLDLAGVERPHGTRGESMLDELSEDRTCYVETQGLADPAIDLLTSHDIEQTAIDQLNEPKSGVATRDGYAYEALDGSISQNGEIPDTRKLLQELEDDLDVRDVSGESVEASAELHAHLEALGYA